MASTYLQRTPGSAGNRRKWTFSCWLKRSNLVPGGDQQIMSATNGSNTVDEFKFQNDKLKWVVFNGSSNVVTLRTTRVFRDISAWYHIVLQADTENVTSTNRWKLYVNGEQVSFDDETDFGSQNLDAHTNAANVHRIGTDARSPANHMDGCFAHIHFTDGSLYDASVFGETDSTTGIWKPKLSPSVTYGTNGYFLKFASSGSMGTDSSGNGNNFTVSGNLTQTQDTPSNVFATFNPLARNNGNTYTNGNTVYDYSNNYQKSGIATQTFSSGKWYAEFKKNGSEMPHYGIAGDTYHSDGRTVTDTSGSWTYDIKGHTGTVVLQIDGSGTRNIWADGSDTGTDTDFYAGTGDIIMIAFDSDTGKIWFGKNGTWSNSGNPATGSNPTYTYSGSATKDFTFAVSTENNSSISANFGNGYFGTTAVSSANSDGGGIGLFEYAVPSGFYALCTKNINTYG